VAFRIGNFMYRPATRGTPADRRKEGNFIAVGKLLSGRCEFVVARHDDVSRHSAKWWKPGRVMIENRAETCVRGKFEPVLGATADILEEPEKEYFDLHGAGWPTGGANRSLTDPLQSTTVSPSVTHVRVRYAETDQMGVVYHANYLIWMEIARTELCKSMGFRYKDMESADGILLAVTEAHCRYLSAARYDEEIAINATIADANRRFVTFDYEMACEGRKVAAGQTKHVFLSREMRPVRLPDKYAPLFGIV
jgi:acyl-CoA thioester hydrolase